MKEEIYRALEKYYTRYYRDDCSLPDWKKRVSDRLNEEDKEKQRLEKLVKRFNFQFDKKKHVIVGAGTAGLAVILNKNYNAESFGVEPESEEFEVIKLRSVYEGLKIENFHKAYGENLPFQNSFFDFAHCFTVLEHVQDVEQCIDEMIRVVKPGGIIIINTPNYSFPYEGHYKIYFPTFLPKLLGYIYLILLGKNYYFYKSINRVTEKSINKILIRKDNIFWYRIYKPIKPYKGFLRKIINIFIFSRFIYPQQDIVIVKENI